MTRLHHDIHVRYAHSLLVEDPGLCGLVSAKSCYYYATNITDLAAFIWQNLVLVVLFSQKLWLSEQPCTCDSLLLLIMAATLC